MLHEYSCLFHADFRLMKIIGNVKIISGKKEKKLDHNNNRSINAGRRKGSGVHRPNVIGSFQKEYSHVTR